MSRPAGSAANPAAVSTTIAATSRFRPASANIRAARSEVGATNGDIVNHSTHGAPCADTFAHAIRPRGSMRKLTVALLSGAYICLSLIAAVLVWRVGGGAGAGAAALLGSLGLC